MGIIVKQGIRRIIWSDMGLGVGFIITACLFPNYPTTDAIALFGLLLAWSVLFT